LSKQKNPNKKISDRIKKLAKNNLNKTSTTINYLMKNGLLHAIPPMVVDVGGVEIGNLGHTIRITENGCRVLI
jgi:hypothetical protein